MNTNYKEELNELEQSIIGTMLTHPEWIEYVMLSEDYFSENVTKELYSTIMKQRRSNQPVSPAAIAMQTYQNSWSRTMITKCSDKSYVHEKDFVYACEKRKSQYIKERLAEKAQDAIMSSIDTSIDAKDILSEMSKKISELYDELENGNRFKNALDAYNEFASEYTKIRMGESDSPFYSTGFRQLDYRFKFTTGLYILAARPSMGKTAMALMFAKHIAYNNKSVLFFSIEMNTNELLMRYAASTIEDEATKKELREYRFNVSDLSAIPGRLPLENIFIDDTPKSIDEIEYVSRKMKRNGNCDMVVIDHMALINCQRDKNGRRDLEVAEISKRLKALAKELRIPVLLLSQLNRECTSRNDKKPMLSDLRESGAIEQDADIVMMLHRPEYYGIDSYTSLGGETLDVKKLGVVIIAKNRNGKVGECYIRFNDDYTTAKDITYTRANIEQRPVNYYESRHEQGEDTEECPF